VKDFVDDLVRLEDKKKSGLTFTVKLTSMICDAPQRSECKGIKAQTGFYCCERCKVKGIKPNNKQGTTYADFNAEKRTDEEWWNYYQEEPPRKDKDGKITVRQ
jgi:hypothetical protein